MSLFPASLLVAFISLPAFSTSPLQQTGSSLPPKSAQSDRDTRAVRPAVVPDFYAPVSLQPLELPPGENAWTVQIASRGGFIGAGRGNLTLTSQGRFTWDGPGGACSRILPEESLQPLTGLVVAAETSASWNGSKVTGMCGDCYVTTMVLQRRESDGVERTYNLTWDDASNAQIPAEALKIYEAFISHAGCTRQADKPNPRTQR